MSPDKSLAVKVVFCVLAVCRARRVFKDTCGSEASFYRIASDHILDEEPIWKNITEDLVSCTHNCINVTKCVAMNTQKRDDKKIDCHLLKDDHMSKPRKMIVKQGWDFYDTGSREISRKVGTRCLMMSENPCPDHCTCVDTCLSYRCDCYGPEMFPSCREALEQYPGSRVFHWIKPEGIKQAVYVQCVKNADNTHSALFEHDSEARTKVTGFEAAGSYVRKISYPINTVADMSAFVDARGSCRQHTKFECYGMVLMNHGWVLDRNLRRVYFYGGGPTSGGCACGITGTCRDSSTKCNCDANLFVNLQDAGFFTKSSILPLTAVKLGDTGGSQEYGYHTIGKLECFDTFTSCSEAQEKYSSGGPKYWIKAAGASQASYTTCTT